MAQIGAIVKKNSSINAMYISSSLCIHPFTFRNEVHLATDVQMLEYFSL